MRKAGIIGLVVTLLVVIPVVFLISRPVIGTKQALSAVAFGLVVLVWGFVYVLAIDPWLRRGIGSLFNTKIEWSGDSWEAGEGTGCLASLVLFFLCYFFIVLLVVTPAILLAWPVFR
jgi:hypothetical protein